MNGSNKIADLIVGDNAKGKHNYSRQILKIDARIAIQQMPYEFSKFVSIEGIYNWSKPKTNDHA